MHHRMEILLLMGSMQRTNVIWRGNYIIGKLESNNTSNIGMLPSTSKGVSIKSSEQCIHIINNKERWNGIKCSTKMKDM